MEIVIHREIWYVYEVTNQVNILTEKPHGQLYLQIGGIGKVTEHILRDALGISTCEEILQNGSYICALFSHSTSGHTLVISFYH